MHTHTKRCVVANCRPRHRDKTEEWQKFKQLNNLQSIKMDVIISYHRRHHYGSNMHNIFYATSQARMIRTEKAAIVEFHVFTLVLQFDGIKNGVGRNKTRQTYDIQQVVKLDEWQSHGRHCRCGQLLVSVALSPLLDCSKYVYLWCTEWISWC